MGNKSIVFSALTWIPLMLFGCATKENTNLYMIRSVADKPARYGSVAYVGDTQEVVIQQPPQRKFYSIWLVKPNDSIIGIHRIEVVTGASVLSKPVIDNLGISASFKALKVGVATLVFFTDDGKHTTNIKVVEREEKPTPEPKKLSPKND